MQDYAAEYMALRAANDRMRETGKAWLWETITRICADLNRSIPTPTQPDLIQIARQEWQFMVEQSTMVGERLGLRYSYRTLLIEVGWPRLPEHGFVPDNGLARGRLGFSQNVMLDPRPLAEIILKRGADTQPVWHLIDNKKLGEILAEPVLRAYLNLLLKDN